MRTRCIVFLFVTMLISAGIGCDEKPASIPRSAPKIQWMNLYSEDNWTEYRASLIHIDSDGYYVVGQSHFRNTETKFDGKMWIWKLDLQGNRIWSKDIVLPEMKEGKRIVWDDLLCLKDERLIIARESLPNKGTWLIRFNERGDITFTKKLALGNRSYGPKNIARTEDGLLISGRRSSNNGDAWVLKIDFGGNELWQKTYDKGKSEAAISMAVAEDGSFILAADSGEYNKFGGGESKVWIVKCDKMGNVLKEKLFPGRHPTIAMTMNGTCAVSYNIADFPSVKLRLMGLDNQLNEIWRTETLYEGPGLGMYKVATDSRNNFVVAGSKFGALWLWRIDGKGRQLWSTSVDNEESVVMVESLLVNGRKYILAGSASINTTMPRDENNKLRKDVQWDTTDILIAKVAEIDLD